MSFDIIHVSACVTPPIWCSLSIADLWVSQTSSDIRVDEAREPVFAGKKVIGFISLQANLKFLSKKNSCVPCWDP
jgi:hypothetical protein